MEDNMSFASVQVAPEQKQVCVAAMYCAQDTSIVYACIEAMCRAKIVPVPL